MSNSDHNSKPLKISEPSPWVKRWSHLIKAPKSVLDLAAGGGRHGRLFVDQGCCVTFVDKSIAPLTDLKANPLATVIQTDLESGNPWLFKNQTFDGIIVVNYLHRPLFENLISSLSPGGVLIYETFALGNEIYNRPRNPEYLLKNSELLERFQGQLNIVAYEHGLFTNADITGVKQRLCAINDVFQSNLNDHPPKAHPLEP